MKSFRRTLPWLIAALFAAAFLVVLVGRRTTADAGRAQPSSASPVSTPAKKVLYWVDPMHPAYKSDKPGTAPDCGMDLVPVYEEAPTGAPRGKPVAGYSTISVPPERQQAIGVQLGKVEVRDLTKTIRAVGRVTFDETLLHQVHAKFEGYIEELYVDYTGKAVRKGQPLLSIYSPDLLATQQEYLLAFRARQQFRGSSNADLSRGGTDLYESARQRLLLWDISPADLDQLEKTGRPRKALTLYSPVSGFVMVKNAVQGGRVMPSDSLFEIAGLQRVWVLADVYESEAPFVSVGQSARMSLSYLPGRTWTGKVTFIAPVLDETTRTVKVRVEFANPDGVLKPEMYSEVLLERPLGRVVAVPESAVLTTGTRSIVFVAKGGGQFEPREVKPGARVDSYYEIREGLAGGEDVVTQANFLVDSESRLKAALTGMAPASDKTPAALPHKH
ncbi:MAG: efflux RND transporter periplasmic adaptor subunit [Acidobacteriota bacterium]|nr:efflux RND transporter periplasmic adaptor subunit [Acidobacteriota bacterium]